MYDNSGFADGVLVGQNAANNNSGWMNGGWEWIWIILLFAFWGNNGWGFGGNNGMNGALTRGDLCQDMNFNNLEGAVRGIANGICDSTFALNNTMTNGFAGVQQTLSQGFGGINTALVTQGYETRLGTQALGAQLASCCCDIRSDIQGVNYNMATNTCTLQNTMNNNTRDIIDSQREGTQAILSYLCNEKISSLQSENAALTAQLSQNAQTRTLIDTLLPVARPAYITCSPYQSAFGYPYAGYGYNNGCGCSCGNNF